MKFEANIPSYLKTGLGVFPVKGKSTPKEEKEVNFFKLMQKGVTMPVSNEVKGTESVALGSPGMNQPMSEGNFLEKMQNKMAAVPADKDLGPKRFPREPNVINKMPMLPERRVTPPELMEARAENEEDQDIIIS